MDTQLVVTSRRNVLAYYTDWCVPGEKVCVCVWRGGSGGGGGERFRCCLDGNTAERLFLSNLASNSFDCRLP